ncbi:MAG: hypothetical protein U0414_19205 [Polyangiaceae bacterium]
MKNDKRVLTTAKVRVGKKKGTKQVVARADEVTFRLQLAPGAEEALVIRAPYALPWSTATVTGSTLAAHGTIPKDAPIEFKLPLSMFVGGSQIQLEIHWGTGSTGQPLRVQYLLQWSAYHEEVPGMQLVSLGYATGFLATAPDLWMFADPLTPAANPPVVQQPLNAAEQQAVLSFEADHDLEHRGVFDADALTAVHDSKGGN